MSTFGYRRRTEIDEREARAYLESAVEFAIAAGKVTLPYFRERLDVDNKGAGGLFDPVTEADRAAGRFGLKTMEERASSIGATLSVAAGRGEGVALELRMAL